MGSTADTILNGYINGRINDFATLRGTSLSKQVEPLYLAHRGGANIYPENTMEAFKRISECGISFLEMDVRTLRDGALAVMHNDTVDAMTTSTGDVAVHTSMSWQNLVVDGVSNKGNSFGNLKAPFFEDILRTFGDKVIYAPEDKDLISCSKIVSSIQKYKLEKNCIIQSFSLAGLAPAVAAGIPALYLKASDGETAATIKAAGITYVGLSTSCSNAYITSMITSGLKVIMYTVNTHKIRDTYLALGVHGFFSDDPLYLSGAVDKYRLATDPFATNMFYHGIIGNNSPTYCGMFLNGRWGFAYNASTSTYCVSQGWANPIAKAAESYVIDLTMTFDDVGVDPSRFGSIGICSPTDYFADAGAGTNGYHILVRPSGTINVYKVTNGSAALLSALTLTTAAIVSGGTAVLKIEVTPTNLKITRVDTANTANLDENTFRGAYLHFCHKVVGVTFSGVSIT